MASRNPRDPGGVGAAWATDRRREVQVGGGAVQMALLDKLAPALGDWLVGIFGVRAQKTRRGDTQAARDPSLFRAASGTPPVRGPWRARNFSVLPWASENRAMMLAAGTVGRLAGLAGQRYNATKPKPVVQRLGGWQPLSRAEPVRGVRGLFRAKSPARGRR